MLPPWISTLTEAFTETVLTQIMHNKDSDTFYYIKDQSETVSSSLWHDSDNTVCGLSSYPQWLHQRLNYGLRTVHGTEGRQLLLFQCV